ncbi:hypothetical protein BJY01DRAFT_254334 [Aspergillus pseudoustus]|uniref:Uncharacterized protein n=1 Tax=Aspergillus pseudoustus TaxID=1810923 RepID=A0ABR4IU41_9EURO
MVFSTTAKYIWLDRDIDTDETYLYAELQANNRNDWDSSSVALETVLGVTEECKGFDTRKENSASNQNYTLQSRFVPGSLTLKPGPVLHGKLLEEYGGWETSIYLDVLFRNDNAELVPETWSNCLMTSGAAIGHGDRDSLRALLVAPNGNLALSQLSLADDCEYVNEGLYRGDDFAEDFGILRPMGSDPSRWVVCTVGPRLEEEEILIHGQKRKANSAIYDNFRASLWKSLNNSEGKLSAEPPQASDEEEDRPVAVREKLQASMPNVAFAVAGEDQLSNEITRAKAQCVFTAVMACGVLLPRLFFGKAGAAYIPALSLKAGLVAQSATGPFVSDPTMRNVVAAIAIYRALKAELPAITGITAEETFKIIGIFQGRSSREEQSITWSQARAAGKELERRKLDESVLAGTTGGWDDIASTVQQTLAGDSESPEDQIKHWLGNRKHDGVDLLNPPAPGEDAYLDQWRQNVRAVQEQLYLLEPDIGSAVEETTKRALEDIATGLDALNQLLEFWPDYKGDDETNEKRKVIIQAAADPVRNAIQTIKDADEDGSLLGKVIELEQKLIDLKTKFAEETAAEQAALDQIKSELKPAVEKMFADKKIYQSAQGQLAARDKETSAEEDRHTADPTSEGGATWYKDLLRRHISALEANQSAADVASTTYISSVNVVTDLQARQVQLDRINKGRYSVDREIGKAEMIIRVLKRMMNGTKQDGDRILSLGEPLEAIFTELIGIGAPPYHRMNRKIEDQLCTAVLKIHRVSLIDASFVESAQNAVTAVQEWFDDDYMPDGPKKEIEAIVNNKLYQASPEEGTEDGPLVGGG